MQKDMFNAVFAVSWLTNVAGASLEGLHVNPLRTRGSEMLLYLRSEAS
jgi:hypothetical protein